MYCIYECVNNYNALFNLWPLIATFMYLAHVNPLTIQYVMEYLIRLISFKHVVEPDNQRGIC